MKRFLIILAILMFASPAISETWYTANQHTVAWGAGEGAVSYRIYLKQGNGTPVLLGDVQTTQAVFTLPGVGRYYACAQSVNGEDVSEIVCSDLPENCLDGQTFGLKINPGKPKDLR